MNSLALRLLLGLGLLAMPAVAQDTMSDGGSGQVLDGAGSVDPLGPETDGSNDDIDDSGLGDEPVLDDGQATDGEIPADAQFIDDGQISNEEIPADPALDAGSESPPADENPTVIEPEPVDPAYEAQRQLLNSLSSLKLDKFAGFRDRPLFTPSRTPPQVVSDEPPPEEPVDPPPEEPVDTAPPPPNIQLTGVVESDAGRVAVIRDNDSGVTLSLHQGEMVGEWELSVVDTSAITLTQGDQTQEFKLFQPGTSEPPPSGDEQINPEGSDGQSMNDDLGDEPLQVDENGMPIGPTGYDAQPGLGGDEQGMMKSDGQGTPQQRDVIPPPDIDSGYMAKNALSNMRKMRHSAQDQSGQ